MSIHQGEQTNPGVQSNFPYKFLTNSLISYLEQLNQPGDIFDLEAFLNNLLSELKEIVEARFIFIFALENADTLKLRMALPENLMEQNWTIPVGRYAVLQKATAFKKSSFLNNLVSDNDFVLYLKSILNIQVSAFAVIPLHVPQSNPLVLLILKADRKKFLETDYTFIQLFTRLVEHGFIIRRSAGQTETGSNLSGAFLSNIFNQLNFGILVVTAEGTIMYLNQTAANLLQLQMEQAINKNLSDLLNSINLENISKLQNQKPETFERPELELKGPDGEKICIGFTVQPFVEPTTGKKGFILSLKDITYSKELQEEMRRMDRLASLGVMASGIAHEIRNPLAGIKAIAQTFQEEFEPDDPKNEFVTRILRQVNRLDDMLKSLFSYAKPPKANKNFHNVEIVLRDVLGLLRQKFIKHHIKLTESVYPNLPLVYVDASQIQQVLMNLILNSIEAIGDKGEILLEVRPVEKDYTKFSRKPFYQKITSQPFVEIYIKDTGSGISPDNLKQIFNPFFTTKSFGTGLGLSIVYQIVKENNGIIFFESEPGKGTDCHLFLPAFKEHAE